MRNIPMAAPAAAPVSFVQSKFFPESVAALARKLPMPPIWLIIVLAGLLVLVLHVYLPTLFYAETDDAFVQADSVAVVPKVSAYVAALHVTDNTRFQKGQLLVELDPRDFKVAVANAEANVASAEAALQNAQAAVEEQRSMILADDAMLAGDTAKLNFAKQQLVRFAKLASDEAGTVEDFQQAQSNIGEQQAVLMKDQASAAAARGHLLVLQSHVAQADAQIAVSQAVLDRANLNLSYTRIYAGISGSVANRTVQAGNFVEAGETLFSAVPDAVYILANFKETQLAHMRSGQGVTVTADAVPGVTFRGHIDSFQRGTGSYFALLPPENATGNFIKVVQRVPVKIVLDPKQPASAALSPGMSVEASVQINAAPRWLPRFLTSN